MKHLLSLSLSLSLGLLIAGCSFDKKEPATTIYGNWDTQLTDNSGFGLTLSEDGSYVSLSLVVNDTGTEALASTETGKFSISGDMITNTPEKSTCPDATSQPTSDKFTLNGDTLDILDPTGIISLTRNKSAPGSNFLIQFGCFKNGVFTPSNLQNVSP